MASFTEILQNQMRNVERQRDDLASGRFRLFECGTGGAVGTDCTDEMIKNYDRQLKELDGAIKYAQDQGA
jgi:hypothetical protein